MGYFLPGDFPEAGQENSQASKYTEATIYDYERRFFLTGRWPIWYKWIRVVFWAFEQAKFGFSAEALQKLSFQQIACIGHWKKGGGIESFTIIWTGKSEMW